MKRRALVPAVLALFLLTGPASPAAATELAVTVDDLPTNGALPRGATRLAITTQMIQALKRHAVPGVYGFTNGGQLQDNPELEGILQAWRQAGFFFGNHTFSHVDLTRMSAAEYVADIERNEGLLARLSPPGTPRYFRYPYLNEGNTANKRKLVREWLAGRGYTIVPVTVSLEDDWAWNDVYARCATFDDKPAIARLKDLFRETAASRLAAFESLSARLFERPVKHILLLHISAFEALVLDDLLTAYRAAGTRFVSLSAALQDPVYGIDPELVSDAGQTFLEQVALARHVPIPDVLSRSPEELARLCR